MRQIFIFLLVNKLQDSDLRLLLLIASGAGQQGSMRTSTAEIGRQFSFSQQTASRKLRQLAAAGFITLDATPTGCTVSATESGMRQLRRMFGELRQLFAARKPCQQIEGTVKTGLGEGRYYISRKPYLLQFKKKLGFMPFFGTLNIVVGLGELQEFLAGKSPAEIEGFETGERAFGPIKAYPVKAMGKQPAAIIFPERSAHGENEIEIISGVNLRKKFRLKEGSKFSIAE